MRSDRRQSTAAARAGMEDDAQYGAVAPPVHLSSTFSFAAPGEPRLHDYTRSGNPTRDLLAEAMAELERGAGATITASGMGAIAVALQLVAPGGRLVAPADCYGGTWRLIDALARRGALEVEWVRFDRPGEWRRALARPADTVWLESPSNPLLRVCDVASIAASAKAGGARVVVDNTFLSPVLMQPLALGADLVVHSTTKYINGHSDVLGGAIIAAEPGTAEHCAWWANCLGITAGAFDSWMTLRGLRTLDVRMQRHVANARAVAELLAAHPAVAKVFYPGLANDPGHRIAAGQQRAPGGIVSFELAGGYEAVRRCLAGLRWFTLAESLGGTESLVAHPATMTHAAMSAAARERAGIGPGLLRLSVGIEDCDDLLDDLRKGLDRARASDGLESRAGAGG